MLLQKTMDFHPHFGAYIMTVNTLSNDTIASLTLPAADDALQTRQKELAAVFAEAKGDDGSLDFNRVKCLGNEVKGSIAVAERVKQMDSEMNALGEAIDTLRAAEKAAKSHEENSKARRSFPLPGGGAATGQGNYGSERERFKSLGEMVTGTKDFQNWAGKGAGGGLTLNFEDALPSDFMGAGASFQTIGTKALMSLASGYASDIARLPGFVEAVTRPIQLLDIIPMGTTGKDAVPYSEETTRIHGAAAAAEGGAYAESAFAFTEKSSPVRKITDSVPVTDEQLDDESFIAGYINGRLVFGIRQKFDRDALIGDGLGSSLRGLKNVAGIQTQAKGAVVGDNIPNAFYRAMTKVRVVGRSMPTHHVMHPYDWQTVRLERTADGVYIWGNPSEAGPERLWGLSVVQNDADAQGSGYTGSFTPDCVSAFERKGVDIQVGFVGNQFGEGKRTIRGDMRAALVWFRPAAFCSVTGLNA
jgi:HK97 family phage major capsid protein